MVEFLAISPLMSGIAGGIIGAFIILSTTITGLLGYSKVTKLLESTVWKKYGYRANWTGLFSGIILGFIYGFLIWFFFSLIYNALI